MEPVNFKDWGIVEYTLAALGAAVFATTLHSGFNALTGADEDALAKRSIIENESVQDKPAQIQPAILYTDPEI